MARSRTPKWRSNDVVPELAYVALGSNLGDRAAHLAQARGALSLLPGTLLVGLSSIEETAPLGARAQSPYLNQMAAVRTRLAPPLLLAALKRIEHAAGRTRAERWGSRTIDLDIVAFGARRSTSPALVLPHPGLRDRRFWQRELAELQSVLARNE
jgi:2-amino-4-hydroxy-6-hydroxymethyldihydropteridine diphosphokinase